MERSYEVLGRHLQIHLGDITRLEVDAIVSSENSDLLMDEPGGPSVSGAIRKVEGEELARDLARLGPIEPGRAVLTPARRLPCRWVVHAAAVVKTEEGHRSSLAVIRAAVRSSLQLASGLGLSSIAMPAFGVRAAELPRAQASQAMVEEIVATLRERTSLRRVVIALIDPESFLSFFEEAMRSASRLAEPLVLRVERGRPSGPASSREDRLELAWEDGGPIGGVSGVAFDEPLERALREGLARLRRAAERRLLDPAEEVRALGARAAELLPPPVRERLAAEPARPLLLRLDERLAWLPFELARDGERALAEGRQVSRLLVTRSGALTSRTPPAPRERLEALILAGGAGELPAAAVEAEALIDLLWRRGQRRARATLLADRRARRRPALAALEHADIVHWCGHTRPAPAAAADRSSAEPAATADGGPCEPRWTLGGGDAIGPEDLSGLRLRARLVVANSCGVDDGALMARAFLLAGARNYVGARWDVDDDAARGFALHLYEELLLGRSLGDALLTAREQLRVQDPVHWAAYVHYGDPRDRLFEALPLPR